MRFGMLFSWKISYVLTTAMFLFGVSQLLAILVLADDQDGQETQSLAKGEVGPVTINGVPYTGDTGSIISLSIRPRLREGPLPEAAIRVAQAPVFSVSPIQHAIAQELNWLITNQHPDGSWGNPETTFRDTSEVIETLRYLEQRDHAYSNTDSTFLLL